MMQRSIELRSDTFTRPSLEMRRAMAEAEVGDDVWNEDPTIHLLESTSASLTGKEAGLFVSSGTQGNLIGILSQTERGQEIIVGDESHVFRYETAGTAVIGGLQMRTVSNRDDGRMWVADVAAAIRGSDIHEPRTGCVCVENTHNRCGGRVLDASEMAGIANAAHAAGVPVHLDGARVFNAAVALNVPVSDLTRHADTVTFCLSKGLGAPVGSLLCGSSEVIERGRRWRKMLGGGMRQAGVLAAAGLYALEHNINRLACDHANARRLADGLAMIPGIGIEPSSIQTNIVFFDVADLEMSASDFVAGLADFGVRMSRSGERVRAVTSFEMVSDDIDGALDVVRRVAGASVPVAV